MNVVRSLMELMRFYQTEKLPLDTEFKYPMEVYLFVDDNNETKVLITDIPEIVK